MTAQSKTRGASTEETRQIIGMALAHSVNTTARATSRAVRKYMAWKGWKGNPEITFSWNGGTTPAQNPHWGEYNFLVEYDGSLYHISLRRQEDGRFYNV